MNGLATILGAIAVGAFGYGIGRHDRVQSWAATRPGRHWARRVWIASGLCLCVASGVFPVSQPAGIAVFLLTGVVGVAAAGIAAAGAAVDARQAARSQSLGRRLRTFWGIAAAAHRVTRYGLVVGGAGFLLAALTGGIAVTPPLSVVGGFAFGGLLAVLGGLTAVGALVPGAHAHR
ncbi:hypothetical protein, partial [Halobacterium salinarum]